LIFFSFVKTNIANTKCESYSSESVRSIHTGPSARSIP
jgi:hypothetical protein